MKASWAGESGICGYTLAASVQENSLGLAMRKLMESVVVHFGLGESMWPIMSFQSVWHYMDVRPSPRHS